MSGPQFIRIQTFSRKANPAGQSVNQVLAEADRDPEFSLHVKEPLPPRIRMGLEPSAVQEMHDKMVSDGRVSVQLRSGQNVHRGVRKDRHTLLTAIASHPYPATLVLSDEKARHEYEIWVQRNIDWLKAQFGDGLVGVVEHWDEEHPHIHAYVLPVDDPTCSARHLNPAWLVKQEAEDDARSCGLEDKMAVKLGNQAYKKRAREFQDAYHADVGVPCGLTRTGPKRGRLSRKQWKEEKAAARYAAELNEQIADRVEGLAKAIEDFETAADEKALEAEAQLAAAAEYLADAEADRKVADQVLQDSATESSSSDRKYWDRIRRAEMKASEIEAKARDEAAAILEFARDQLRVERERIATADRRIAEERAGFEASKSQILRDAVTSAAIIAVEIILGVFDGSVGSKPDGLGWFIRDETLRKKTKELGIGQILKQVVGAVEDVWQRLKEHVSEVDLAREQLRSSEKLKTALPKSQKTKSDDASLQP